MQPDKENIKKYKNFWQNLAKKLQTLGYNVSIITFHIYIYIYIYIDIHIDLKSVIDAKHNE